MKVRYRGSPSSVGLLAQMLSEEGLEVDFAAPLEDRDTAATVVEVVMYVADNSVDSTLLPLVGDKVSAARKRFHERVPRAEVNVVDDKSTREAAPDVE